MDKLKLIIVIVVIVAIGSLVANVFLASGLLAAEKKSQQLEQSMHVNAKILDFGNLFIDKVLRATGEISFEDRLKIENAVRDTQDKEIYDSWQKFVGVTTETEGREEIKNLLQLILNKVSK